MQFEVAAKHVANDRFRRRVPNAARANESAIPQNGHSVDEAEQFIQTVAYVEDARSRGAEAPEHLKQMERVGSRQRGGRLVEDDDAGVARKRPHNAEDGFARGAQRTHWSARIRRIDRHSAIDLFGLQPNLAPGDEAAGLGKPRHQRDVLANAQFVDQAKVLVDKRNRHGFRMGMNATAAHQDFAESGW